MLSHGGISSPAKRPSAEAEASGPPPHPERSSAGGGWTPSSGAAADHSQESCGPAAANFSWEPVEAAKAMVSLCQVSVASFSPEFPSMNTTTAGTATPNGKADGHME